MAAEPVAVHAITTDGSVIPCAVFPDGTERMRGSISGSVTFRRFRVVIEFDWARMPIARMEVTGWPDDVMFVFSVPGMNPEEAQKKFASVGWKEKVGT